MNIDDLTIGQLKRIQGMALGGANADSIPGADGSLKIIVADRGWNFVGKIFPDGRVDDARCIIRWGTSKGLGELCNSGPTADTILGDTQRITIPTDKIIVLMDVNKEVWT